MMTQGFIKSFCRIIDRLLTSLHGRIFCRQLAQDAAARVCLHIQKPKPQASIKNKIDKFHKLFDVYNTIHKG